MFGLKAETLQLALTFLIPMLSLIVFFLFQLKDFLDWGLLHMRWDIVFLIEILVRRKP
jgi:hypothetical protein